MSFQVTNGVYFVFYLNPSSCYCMIKPQISKQCNFSMIRMNLVLLRLVLMSNSYFHTFISKSQSFMTNVNANTDL